jgi:RND family efflux transporter MFP subunit
MSESNGTATPGRISAVLLKSNGSVREWGEPHDRAFGNQQEGRSTRSLGIRSKVRRAWVGVAVACILIAASWLTVKASSKSEAVAPNAPRVLAVQTVSVELVNTFQMAREYTGSIVAHRTSELGFELAGKLTELHVNEGDSVTAGAVLALLDTEHLETNRRQVVAKRAQAIAKLEEMVRGPRDEDISAARARVTSYQAQVELLKRQTARLKKLIVSHAASQDEYEQYAFGLQSRLAQLNEASHDLDELLNGTRKEQVEVQRAVFDELDAAVADIDIDLRKSQLAAPFNGTIARRHADEGTVVEAGQPVYRLIEDQALEAWIGLPVHATGQLVAGSLQRVNIHGQHFDATVMSRFPEVDPTTRTRTVVLSLEASAAAHIVHGQVVRLELEETVEASGFWLPITSLTKGPRGLWTSFVVVKSNPKGASEADLHRVESREIEVLNTQSDRVLVHGGLIPGDQVIARGTHRVVPGQLVRLTRTDFKTH